MRFGKKHVKFDNLGEKFLCIIRSLVSITVIRGH